MKLAISLEMDTDDRERNTDWEGVLKDYYKEMWSTQLLQRNVKYTWRESTNLSIFAKFLMTIFTLKESKWFVTVITSEMFRNRREMSIKKLLNRNIGKRGRTGGRSKKMFFEITFDGSCVTTSFTRPNYRRFRIHVEYKWKKKGIKWDERVQPEDPEERNWREELF